MAELESLCHGKSLLRCDGNQELGLKVSVCRCLPSAGKQGARRAGSSSGSRAVQTGPPSQDIPAPRAGWQRCSLRLAHIKNCVFFRYP